MIDRRQYAEAKEFLKQYKNLSPQEQERLRPQAYALAGYLCSPWFPVSWTRRLIMAGIVLLGLQQAATGNYEPLIWWGLLPFSPPRLMGGLSLAMGKFQRLFGSESINPVQAEQTTRQVQPSQAAGVVT